MLALTWREFDVDLHKGGFKINGLPLVIQEVSTGVWRNYSLSFDFVFLEDQVSNRERGIALIEL